MPGPVIEISDLTFSYGSKVVLEDVDLKVEEGDFVSVVGPNGGGKTTLLKLILGLLEPQRGRVRISGNWRRSILTATGRATAGCGRVSALIHWRRPMITSRRRRKVCGRGRSPGQ